MRNIVHGKNQQGPVQTRRDNLQAVAALDAKADCDVVALHWYTIQRIGGSSQCTNALYMENNVLACRGAPRPACSG